MAIPRVQTPLGKASPYIIPGYAGESMMIPGSKSTIRILASAKETDNLISVFHMDGVTGDPVGFHYHNEAHDIFMCTKGQMKVWAGDQCRILGPGDFCSVPPKIIHSPQMIDPYNETIGLVTPGDWVDFFRFISEPYSGTMTDEFDTRDTKGAIFSKFQEIKEKYDVVFQPQFQPGELSEWSEKDSKLPDDTSMYYLKANTGPRYLLEGVLSRPFITTKQSAGKFAITSIESSSKLPNTILSKPFSFAKVHQVYCVLDGAIEVTIDGKSSEVRAGESVFIPAGTSASIKFLDNYVRFWAYASGDALETLISKAGEAYEGTILPDKVRDVDFEGVSKLLEGLGVR